MRGNWPGLPQGSQRSHWAEERPGIRLAVVTVAAATAAEVAAVPPAGVRGPGQPWELWEASSSIRSPRGPGPAASTQILALAQCWDGNCWAQAVNSVSKLLQDESTHRDIAIERIEAIRAIRIIQRV